MKTLYMTLLLGALSTGFVATASAAEEAPMATGESMQHNGAEMGKHAMSGTITHIDHKTGFITVRTDLGKLHVHYPPSTIKALKKGEKITVHLSFTTP